MIENKGINLNLQDKTPIHYLFENKSITKEIIKLMIENKGINLNLQDKTPLHYLYLNPSVTMEIIQFLIDKGYLQEINPVEIEKELKLLDDEFNKSYYNGATLLHYFAQKEPINKDLFNHFINSGADWNKQDVK
ncbi:ankyrin repeat and socs box containing 4 [Anaeramoeba ignava]|uniref:Ankyrin repeat and socs box containing 4 n=1 Tax=Anaeramoeba ignava TaxID=1746090 RepID=A0A9Q0LB63_ANAIG|nr:ankyrin repeat and socs box containing 4 [Anaeramoeba ignava]